MVNVTTRLTKIRATVCAVVAVTLVYFFNGVVPLETTVVVSHDTLDTELSCARSRFHLTRVE